MKKPPPGTPDDAASEPRTHESLAGKILQVFRVHGDSERSVGRHGAAAAMPEAPRSGPVQHQLIDDASGPVQERSISDLPPAAHNDSSALPTITLREGAPNAVPPVTQEPTEPIRLQTFSIDMAERLANLRAAQQDVFRELDKYDESGDNLGKAVDRKR